MTKKFICLILGLVLLMAAFGCSNKSTNTDPDQAAILTLIGQNADMTGSDVLSPADQTLSKAAVDSIKLWWRQLLARGRIIGWGVRQPADSTHPFPSITVTLIDSLEGILHIVGTDSSDTVHLEKPFTEVATRLLYFEKRGLDATRYRGWVLAGVSGIELVSVPNTAKIDSVKIESGAASQTVRADSILAITLRPDIIEFAKGDSVNVTVYTGDATDSVYLHAHIQMGTLPSHRRKKLANNGDGSFSGYIFIPSHANFFGRWHLVVDVLKGHVLASDDLNDYDSRQWGLLYRVGVPD
ncbi:MAG: hypothetical protein L0196_02335 [candidate division Zixibacteria bacterium]|nr:hypothetical protein [candidate division Zixibacteria bacterium]